MIKLLLLLILLVTVCVIIHGIGSIMLMRWLIWKSARKHHKARLPATLWMVSRLVLGLLALHLLQIFAWAACYSSNDCFPDFITSFYYSATSYSTAGYGDVIAPGNWRIFGAIEAVTGILMFGWSTGILFSVVQRLMADHLPVRKSMHGGLFPGDHADRQADHDTLP